MDGWPDQSLANGNQIRIIHIWLALLQESGAEVESSLLMQLFFQLDLLNQGY